MEKTPIMFAAIRTKFVGPTNYRGSRVSASCQAGRKVAVIIGSTIHFVEEN